MSTTMQHRLLRYGEGNLGWGNLHIVMEDGNLEDVHLKWCVENSLSEGDGEAAVLAHWMLQLTDEQREHLYQEYS